MQSSSTRESLFLTLSYGPSHDECYATPTESYLPYVILIQSGQRAALRYISLHPTLKLAVVSTGESAIPLLTYQTFNILPPLRPLYLLPTIPLLTPEKKDSRRYFETFIHAKSSKDNTKVYMAYLERSAVRIS